MTTLLVRHPPHAAEGLPARYPEVPLANPIQFQEHEFELTEITFRCRQARLLFRPGDEFNRAPGPRRPRGGAATAAVGEACLKRDTCCEIGSLGPIETSNFVEMSGRSDHGGSESREPEGRKASCATRWSAPSRHLLGAAPAAPDGRHLLGAAPAAPPLGGTCASSGRHLLEASTRSQRTCSGRPVKTSWLCRRAMRGWYLGHG